MKYSNIHLYRVLHDHTAHSEQPQSLLTQPSGNKWTKWVRANESIAALTTSSAICVLYAKYLTDALIKEGKELVHIGKAWCNAKLMSSMFLKIYFDNTNNLDPSSPRSIFQNWTFQADKSKMIQLFKFYYKYHSKV